MKANKKGLYEFGQTHKKDDKVIISSEYFTNDRPSYICSFCSQTLIKLSDAAGNNNMWWCRNCSVQWDPEEENLRKESKITVPDRNIEPAVATTSGIPDISIHHTPELKGAFKALQEKGLRITDYREE
jgi:hypothetical protein